MPPLEQPLQRGVQRLRLFEGEFDGRPPGCLTCLLQVDAVLGDDDL